MVTSLEMEVVGTITIRDTSLIASLGEYFSPFPFVVLYHFHLVMFQFLVLKITKTQKDFICFFCLFTSGHLPYASKN